MSDDVKIRQLLREVLDSDITPEQACREHPELLPQVSARLREVRLLDADVDVLFPSADRGGFWTPSGSGPAGAGFTTPQVDGYEIQSMLGLGGMGVVYKAWHHKLNRTVAIKFMRSAGLSHTRELNGILREAQAVAGLRHPHIVQVHDVNEVDGLPYFTMEFVEGGTLAQRFGGNPQSPTDAARLLVTLAETVEAAHRGAIVHRDLKPSNILLTAEGDPKITDFGLARRVEGSSALTLTGARGGTPSYMAPEQALGESTAFEPGVDIYALGAILYEALTGRPPFRGESPEETQRKLISEEPIPPSRMYAKVPRDLDVICLKCLAKNPKWRYQTAADLAADLKRFLAGEPIHARAVGRTERLRKWISRKPAESGVLAASTVTVFIIAGVLAWNTWQRHVNNRSIEEYLQQVVAAQQAGDWGNARTMLERARARLAMGASTELNQSVRQAGDELEFVSELERLRLNRAKFLKSNGALSPEQASAEYRKAFLAREIPVESGEAELVAGQISRSSVRSAIVAAMDDWSQCDPALSTRIFAVTARADPDPWRNKVRDPAILADKEAIRQLTIDPPVDNQPVQLLLALAAAQKKAGGDSIPLLHAVQRKHPDDFWANFELGVALSDVSDAEAVGFLRAAAAIRPDSTAAHFNLGKLFMVMNRSPEAIFHFRRVLELKPDHAATHNSLATSLGQSGQLDEAMLHFHEAVRLNPGDFRALANVGSIYSATGRISEAAAVFRKAVVLAPNEGPLRMNLAVALRALGEEKEADTQYRKAVELAPSNAVVRMRYGQYLRNSGRLREAVDENRAALAVYPNHIVLKRNVRALLVCLGEGERARAEWQADLASEPPEHDAWHNYAELSLFLGQRNEYDRVCRALLARFGETTDPQIADRVGRTCLLSPRSEEERAGATALIERGRTYEVPPKDSLTKPNLEVAQAMANFRNGRFAEAIAILNAERVPTLGPIPKLIVAMSQYRLGLESEARASLAEAVSSFDWTIDNLEEMESWSYHVWRREAETMLLPNIGLFREHKYWPESNDERLALQGICQFENLTATSAQLYAEAFAENTALESAPLPVMLASAAQSAGLAACGGGTDASLFRSEDRERFRALSHQWLRRELVLLRASFDNSNGLTPMNGFIDRWFADSGPSCVRDVAACSDLPPAERAACESLSREAYDVLLRTRVQRMTLGRQKESFPMSPGNPRASGK